MSTMLRAQFCRDQAELANAEADAANLENVREQALRSRAVWLRLAEQAERVYHERIVREDATRNAARD